jgi:hypothetical protein
MKFCGHPALCACKGSILGEWQDACLRVKCSESAIGDVSAEPKSFANSPALALCILPSRGFHVTQVAQKNK